MTEPKSEAGQKKAAAKSNASQRAAVDKAGEARAEAVVASQLAEQEQHDAKVALQNAKFDELGERMDIGNRFEELGVTMKGNQGR